MAQGSSTPLLHHPEGESEIGGSGRSAGLVPCQAREGKASMLQPEDPCERGWALLTRLASPRCHSDSKGLL